MGITSRSVHSRRPDSPWRGRDAWSDWRFVRWGALDLMLNSNTIQLAGYEKVVAAAQREPFVYRALAEVRDYRAKVSGAL
jgi:hypothetical protein